MKALRLIYFLFAVTTLLIGEISWAQARRPETKEVKYDSAREEEIAQRSKRKIYPGGKDESELKVQPALTKPTRKINPSVDESQDREAEHD